jgi:hypothetical protein
MPFRNYVKTDTSAYLSWVLDISHEVNKDSGSPRMRLLDLPWLGGGCLRISDDGNLLSVKGILLDDFIASEEFPTVSGVRELEEPASPILSHSNQGDHHVSKCAKIQESLDVITNVATIAQADSQEDSMFQYDLLTHPHPSAPQLCTLLMPSVENEKKKQSCFHNIACFPMTTSQGSGSGSPRPIKSSIFGSKPPPLQTPRERLKTVGWDRTQPIDSETMSLFSPSKLMYEIVG